MPVVVACPKCKKKYKLPDKMLGKGVKCTECGTQFRAPAPKSQGSANQHADQAANQQARVDQARQNQALEALGVEGTIERPADVFSGPSATPGNVDPLANHVIHDPGFGEEADIVIAPAKLETSDNPYESMFSNPALVQEQKKKGLKGKKRQVTNQNTLLAQPWLLITIVFLPIFLLSLLFTFTGLIPPGINLIFTGIFYALIALVNFGLQIWVFVRVYQVSESVVQLLLSMFVPFYVLYFIAVNYEDMKKSFTAYFASAMMLILGMVATMLIVPMMKAASAL